MPKRMHDTSMDRGFGDEYIGINSAQLCALNGRVYTPERHREILIFPVRGLILCFSGPRSRYSNPSIEVLTVFRSRVY